MLRRFSPAMHAASYFDHEKRVAWVFISVHAYGHVPASRPFEPPELRKNATCPLSLRFARNFVRCRAEGRASSSMFLSLNSPHLLVECKKKKEREEGHLGANFACAP